MPAPYRIVTYRKSFHLAHGRPRVRIPLNTKDLGVAEVRASQLWAARNAPLDVLDKVEDIWAKYQADRVEEGVRRDQLDYVWNTLKPVFGYKVGTEITKADCKAYAKSRSDAGRKPSTIRTELEYLRAALNKHYGRGKVSIWMPSASAPRDRFLTASELETLMSEVRSNHVKLFIVLAITTAARMSAILEAKWDDINLTSNTLNFNPAGRTATNKRRTEVPLNKRATAELEKARQMAQTEYIIEFNGQRVMDIGKSIERVAKRAGVPCSPHVFRHTAGVWMAQADVPMQKISQYMGHTSIRVTEKIYARYSPSYMRDAADALEF